MCMGRDRVLWQGKVATHHGKSEGSGHSSVHIMLSAHNFDLRLSEHATQTYNKTPRPLCAHVQHNVEQTRMFQEGAT